MTALNAWLDRLPRTRFGRLAREVPVFRTCGIVGYHVALIAVLAGGLLRGFSLLVLGILSTACALSFYAWAYLRRALTGRERLVLLEHVWIALLVATATLRALREPVLPYLDVIAVGLAFFLAAGRVGCFLVGCCHGRPSELGVAYGSAHCHDGFPRHLAHVRLLPVQAFEALGLLAIGTSGFVALPFAPAGRVLGWFLGAYAIMRFGFEGLRGDRRAHFLGLPVGRWMALAEVVTAVAIAEAARPNWQRAPATLAAASLALLLTAFFVWRWLRSPGRRFLRPAQVARVRGCVREASEAAELEPTTRQTPIGVSVAVSRAPGPGGFYVSIRLPDGLRDLALLCTLAARALPELRAEAARVGHDGATLLVHVAAWREPIRRPERRAWPPLEDDLYGALVRQLQGTAPASSPLTVAREAVPSPDPPVESTKSAQEDARDSPTPAATLPENPSAGESAHTSSGIHFQLPVGTTPQRRR